jgi:hypothetical protein
MAGLAEFVFVYFSLTDPYSNGRERSYHFGALRRGILQAGKKCQNPEILRNLALFFIKPLTRYNYITFVKD